MAQYYLARWYSVLNLVQKSKFFVLWCSISGLGGGCLSSAQPERGRWGWAGRNGKGGEHQGGWEKVLTSASSQKDQLWLPPAPGAL